MANESKRLRPVQIAEDEDVLAALKAISNYRPANPDYSIEAVVQAHDDLRAAQTAEVQAEAAYKGARDTAVEKELSFHNLILGSKDQVTAQFGRNSNEVQAIGLKKASERKAPQRKSGKGSGENSGN